MPTTAHAARPDSRPAPRTRGWSPDQAAAAGGLLFAVVAAAQNVIRSGSLPDTTDKPAAIARAYSGTGTTQAVLAVLFVAGAAGLAVFVGGLVRRTVAERGLRA